MPMVIVSVTVTIPIVYPGGLVSAPHVRLMYAAVAVVAINIPAPAVLPPDEGGSTTCFEDVESWMTVHAMDRSQQLWVR